MRLITLLATTLLLATAAVPDVRPMLEEVSPTLARAGQRLSIMGRGFGGFAPGSSVIVFDDGVRERAVKAPYVWRDDFIQVTVPSGLHGDDVSVTVACESGTSLPATLRMARPNGAPPEGGGTLLFTELTEVQGDFEISGFLGPQPLNLYRTKDADIADADGDGFPDMIDNNSNNDSNDSHAVLRLNNGGQGFTTRLWEPVDAFDNGGPFAVTVPAGGDFVGNAICYDADFIDLDNDGLPDWVQAAAGSGTRVRVAINNEKGEPGRFREASFEWVGNENVPGSPDDVCSADVNGDGFLDVAIGFRFSPSGGLYLNDGGTTFEPRMNVTLPAGGSMHDAFFIDANDDALWDVTLVSESSPGSRVMINTGSLANPSFTPGFDSGLTGETGVMADFNDDDLHDFAVGFISGSVFYNKPNDVGNFFESPLPGLPGSTMYDSEVGDLDLDGDLDLIATFVSTSAASGVRIWRNDGPGQMTNLTSPGTQAELPGAAPFQRMSADLIDFDLDGDLDLYVTGADGAGAPGGLGLAPNQFWESGMIEAWVDVGSGLAGTNGVPLLGGEGSLAPGGFVTLSLSGALESTAGTLFVGLSQLNAPFKGGTLVPMPDITIAGLTTSARGTFEINAQMPDDGLPGGTELSFQFWLPDPAGPVGLAASNGLTGTTP